MSDVLIKAEHLSKMYRLGVINNGTLWKDIQTWFAIKSGKEDPHSIIGENKNFGDKDHFWALKDLNFEIKHGDRIGIIGKNGAGKSTLLKILSRITSPSEGRVKIKGRVASLLEVGTGFHGELTGRENIYLNGSILGMKKCQIDQKIDEIIDFSGIEHHIDTPVKRYSSGMYVRLAFAVAAHLDSDILIADEVLAVGDVEFQKKALGKMQNLSTGSGKTVLFVSHNMDSVIALCNKGMVLKEGRIFYQGLINECKNEYYKMENEVNNSTKWTGRIGDTNIEILKLEILDDKNTVVYSPVIKGDKIYVGIEYIVKRVNRNYVFSVEINNDHDTTLCEISATEYFENSTDLIASVGTHYLKLELDSSIFAQGKYKVKLDFAIRGVLRITNDGPIVVFDIKNVEDKIIIPRRKDIISPDWNWQHHRKNRKE